VTVRPYPTQPDQLTPEWLTIALRNAGVLGDANVTGLTTTPVGEGIGMLGVIARAELTYDRETEAPASVVAKFATPIEGNRAIAMAFRMYEREIHFYRRIAPTVGVAAPMSYAGEVDPDSGDCVLLMEDLSGYDTGDQVVGCTAEQAMVIIDAVVPLHAEFFNNIDSRLEGVPRMDGETQIAGISGACAVGWDPCMQMFGDGVAQEIKDVKEQFVAAVPELHRMLCRGDVSAIHGDLRLDNLMFGQPGQRPVVLLDWSLAISTPLQDVAYLISQNVQLEERRAHEQELIEHYHSRLVELGAEDYSLVQCWHDYEKAVLYLFSYAVVIAGTLDPSNDRGAAFMKELVSRSSATVMDHDLLRLLPS
jgi:hypothetical protein